VIKEKNIAIGVVLYASYLSYMNILINAQREKSYVKFAMVLLNKAYI
jgi:hypothetical protein